MVVTGQTTQKLPRCMTTCLSDGFQASDSAHGLSRNL